MDIRKLVNEGAHQQSRPNHTHATEHASRRSSGRKEHNEHDRGRDSRHWDNSPHEHSGHNGHPHTRNDPAYQYTLPPFSSILPDNYHGGYTHASQQNGHHHPQQAPHPHVNQAYSQPHRQSHPSGNYPGQPLYGHRPDSGRSSHSSNGSSSTVSSLNSQASFSSATTASNERLSASDDDDDDSDDEDGVIPLPPYSYSRSGPPTDSSYSSNYNDSPPLDGADFVCEDCGVSYSRGPDLRKHKATVHNDKESREKLVNTWPCDICGQVLLSSHGYQGHMRRHYDERPFVCEAASCGKAFHDSATLARHRRTHSTEHKFECDFCARRFKRKDNLNTHRKKHQVGGEAINPNLLRKPVTRVSSDSPPNGTPSQTPYNYNDPAYQTAAPPYPTTPGQENWSHHQQHQQAPPYPHQPKPVYPPNVRPTESGRPMVMAMSITPTPRSVKLEDESDYDYMNRERSAMQGVVPTPNTNGRERW